MSVSQNHNKQQLLINLTCNLYEDGEFFLLGLPISYGDCSFKNTFCNYTQACTSGVANKWTTTDGNSWTIRNRMFILFLLHKIIALSTRDWHKDLCHSFVLRAIIVKILVKIFMYVYTNIVWNFALANTVKVGTLSHNG